MKDEQDIIRGLETDKASLQSEVERLRKHMNNCRVCVYFTYSDEGY